jgi:hypothetical protein
MTDVEEGLRAAYREPKGGGAPGVTERPDELRYFPESASRGSSIAVGFAMVPGLAGYTLVTVLGGSKLFGFCVGVAVTAWPIIKQRRARTIPRATLRIEGKQLHLSGPAFGRALSVTLDDLLDVYLDTQTIQRLREAPNPVPMTRFLNQTVGGEQDVARIGLELTNETLFLTEDRVSHLDSNEWFSKIRRFLRQHGWRPEDER